MKTTQSAVAAVIVASLTLCIPVAKSRNQSPEPWTKARWNIRYILWFQDLDHQRAAQRKAAKFNDMSQPDPPLLLDAGDLFEPADEFMLESGSAKAMTVIVFDKDAKLLTSTKNGEPMRGRQKNTNAIVLTGSTDQLPYYLGRWFHGFHSADPDEFAPAVCDLEDDIRYEDRWPPGVTRIADFGCREWTAQLYSRTRPYIDVTTYAKSRSPYIGTFIGWARFHDKPKPVIGRSNKTWYCFYDCPRGEKPGVIQDIRGWVKKHRYPMPTRPAFQPEYPNSRYPHDRDE